ncbi:MAG TPA: DUF481 domain-containing protein [Xanthomonadales bacterium]|nr:DUF481 domain-containing protein [Xanthomonadales bacterium]
MKYHVLVAVFLILFIPASVMAAKTDVVLLKNGDKITGEIKRVGGGLLEFSTDTMGTVYIEWRFIAQVISNTQQSVDTIDGNRYLGKLVSLEEGDAIGIQTGSEMVEVPLKEFFSAWPVESNFWDRSDFDISVGLDYQKSTEIAEFTLAADWAHRNPDRLVEASLRANLTEQPDGTDQRRSQVQYSHQWVLPNNRFRSALGVIETNESLGLDLRLSAGGVFGNYLLRRSDRWLSASYGLIANQEKFTDGTNQTSLEAIGSLTINYFRFADPERSLSSKFTIFPSLTESGRIRSDLRTTFKLEFLSDLFWSMEAYYQSDNKPSQGAATSDYGITTAIGWSL